MGEYEFDYGSDRDFSEMFDKMGQELISSTSHALDEIAAPIKASVEQNIGRSDTTHKGRPHMADDVKIEKKVFARNGGWVKVKGGSKTGRLWHLVNDGHVAENGHFVPGNHFLDKTIADTQGNTERQVDELLTRMVSSNG